MGGYGGTPSPSITSQGNDIGARPQATPLPDARPSPGACREPALIDQGHVPACCLRGSISAPMSRKVSVSPPQKPLFLHASNPQRVHKQKSSFSLQAGPKEMNRSPVARVLPRRAGRTGDDAARARQRGIADLMHHLVHATRTVHHPRRAPLVRAARHSVHGMPSAPDTRPRRAAPCPPGGRACRSSR